MTVLATDGSLLYPAVVLGADAGAPSFLRILRSPDPDDVLAGADLLPLSGLLMV